MPTHHVSLQDVRRGEPDDEDAMKSLCDALTTAITILHPEPTSSRTTGPLYR